MNIVIATPAPAHSRAGNRVTAVRWSRILQSLGHCVRLTDEFSGQECDVLIALHARRSYGAMKLFRGLYPNRRIVLALTGTDLYGDIRTRRSARQALEWADRLVVLQPLAVDELSHRLQAKVRTIYQSVRPPRSVAKPSSRVFQVCVMGHLRPVKDPLRAAKAARLLPVSSRTQVVHVGGALSAMMERAARVESAANPRYRWVGEVPRGRALRILSRSRLLVLTSKMEGGANVISEAIAMSVPVISSRIPGSVGLLGEDYGGYFPVGDTQALAALLQRAETDSAFYESLRSWGVGLQPIFDPARERRSWASLLDELA